MAQDRGSERPKGLLRGVVFTLAGAIAWGFSGTCVQYLFEATPIDAITLTMLRQLGAGLVFVLALLVSQRDTLRAILHDRSSLVRLAIFGACGLFLNSLVYAITISFTNAGTATVLQSFNIVMVLALACAAHRRLPRGNEVAALACAMLAVFLIATHGDVGTLHMPLPGLVFGLLTAAASVFYTTYPKPLFDQWGSFPVTGLGMLVGGLTGLALCSVRDGGLPQLPPMDARAFGVLAIAILVGTFAAYGMFLHGVSIVGPVAGNMLGAAEPVSATVISALWLGTAFSWADWAGLALMVATIILIAQQEKEG